MHNDIQDTVVKPDIAHEKQTINQNNRHAKNKVNAYFS